MKKRPSIAVTDCVFEDNEVGISAPADVAMDLSGSRFTGNKKHSSFAILLLRSSS